MGRRREREEADREEQRIEAQERWQEQVKKQNQLAELERERLRQDAKRERQRGLADRERRTQDRRSVAESFHREMVERERRTLDRRLLAESAAARIADDYVGFWDHDDRKESVDQRATRCAALDAGASSPPCPTLGGSTPPMAKYRQTSAPRSSRATRAEADQPFVWDDIPRQMLQMMSVEDPSVHPAGTPRSGALTPRSGYVGSVDQPRSVASTPRSRLMGSADPPAKARIVASTSRPGRMGSFDPPDTARSAASNSLHGHVGSMDPPVAARSVASTPVPDCQALPRLCALPWCKRATCRVASCHPGISSRVDLGIHLRERCARFPESA